MFTADKWKSYRLIDADGGERLEKWGDYTLIRPDPQIIWKGERKNPLWKKADGIYSRSRSGGGDWVRKNIPEEWVIPYGEMKFLLSPMGFKHTGLFPEQAANWDWFTPIIKASGRRIRLLNLFAYTGGASVAAAKAGAFVCHVDASKGMVLWAKENAVTSGIADKPVRWLVDDCIKFVEREIRRGHHYDGIIMDPPSYGRGPNGEVWKLEDNLYSLIELCEKVLSDNPVFFILNSYSTGLSAGVMEYMLGAILKPKFGGRVSSDEIGLRASDSGLVLPCGSTAIWEK